MDEGEDGKRVTRFVFVVSCRDCTDQDELGCFGGGVHVSEPFDTEHGAEEAARKFVGDCGPWQWEVRAKPPTEGGPWTREKTGSE